MLAVASFGFPTGRPFATWTSTSLNWHEIGNRIFLKELTYVSSCLFVCGRVESFGFSICSMLELRILNASLQLTYHVLGTNDLHVIPTDDECSAYVLCSANEHGLLTTDDDIDALCTIDANDLLQQQCRYRSSKLLDTDDKLRHLLQRSNAMQYRFHKLWRQLPNDELRHTNKLWPQLSFELPNIGLLPFELLPH